MSTCYLCSRLIPPDDPRHRRRVRTGDRTRVSYRTGKVTEALTTYGDRVVCARCASLLDRQRLTGELRKHLLTLILCLLVLAVISFGL